LLTVVLPSAVSAADEDADLSELALWITHSPGSMHDIPQGVMKWFGLPGTRGFSICSKASKTRIRTVYLYRHPSGQTDFIFLLEDEKYGRYYHCLQDSKLLEAEFRNGPIGKASLPPDEAQKGFEQERSAWLALSRKPQTK
jgi:hypothetical protein